MSTFLTFSVIGIVIGCIYAITACGLVVTYSTSGVFNFAHGAQGMFAAWLYWQLTVGWGWPTWLGLVVVVAGIAPLIGIGIERLLIRPLRGRSADVSIVVTLGLLLFLVGLANLVWKQTVIRTLPPLFPGRYVAVLGFNVSYHQLIVLAAAVLVAVALRVFFDRTRAGITMRAAVDNPSLVGMAGANPDSTQRYAWVLGSVLASVAGVLLAPIVTLTVGQLTLLVINGYAAAVVGRLRSLPWTVAGAMLVGLGTSYTVGYGHSDVLLNIQLVIPMIVLFVVLVVIPAAGLRGNQIRTYSERRTTPAARSTGTAVALVLAVVVLSVVLPGSLVSDSSRALGFGIILLSLVLLTGYGGMVSLCQLTFAGLGAYAMSHVGGTSGNPLGLLAAAALAGAVGALVALPTLRLRGLYLALATLAFAQAMDTVVLTKVLGSGGSLGVARPHLPFLPRTDRAYLVELGVVFALAAWGLLALRRGALGRRLAAVDDSPAACATLGLSLPATKLLVFAASAALAGLGGALLVAVPGQGSNNDFVALSSAALLLVARIGGISTVSGGLLGGIFLAGMPALQLRFPQLGEYQLTFLLTGLAAVGLARNPDGIASDLGRALTRISSRLGQPAPELPVQEPTTTAPLTEVAPDAARHTAEEGPVALQVDGVSIRFGGVQALQDVTLTARSGAVTGIIGPNGAGKTTLFNIMTGLARPDTGSIVLNGEDVSGQPTHQRARRGLARTFQRLEVFGSLSVVDNVRAACEIAHGRSADSADRARAALSRAGIGQLADVPAHRLPTGQARLLELARALVTDPQVLLLDEPASGLSHSESQDLAVVIASVAADGVAVVLVEHDVELVMRLCSTVHVLDFGQVIASGSAAEVQGDDRVRAAYLGDVDMVAA
jgi:ABC-type branched-subunit amino acid transport system ATPase component/branched-subunit amino acid ABC-type transport system permease component